MTITGPPDDPLFPLELNGPHTEPDEMPYYAIYDCPEGYELSGDYCVLADADEENGDDEECKGSGAGGSIGVSTIYNGGHITPGTGNNYRVETDYQGTGPMPLVFQRYYNSHDIGWSKLGFGWRSSIDRNYFLTQYGDGQTIQPKKITPKFSLQLKNKTLLAQLKTFGLPVTEEEEPIPELQEGTIISTKFQDGKTYDYTLQNGQWKSDPNVTGKLEQTPLGLWKYTRPDTLIELYNDEGQLLSITHPAGLQHTYSYKPGILAGTLIASISDSFGQSLSFQYDEQNRIKTMTAPGNQSYHYSYTDLHISRLNKVTNPDNSSREYFYEEPRFVYALTSIRDENGNRYRKWSYDENYRVASSEWANGVQLHTFTYDEQNNVSVRLPSGETRQAQTQEVFGKHKLAATQGSCPGCTNTQAITYDANGFKKSRTDFEGNLTAYTYNDSGLPESISKGMGDDAKTVQTTWDTQHRKPKLIVAQEQTTDLDYDNSSGLLLKKTITDTKTQKQQVWTYTYHDKGLLASIDGPRTDVQDITKLDYEGGYLTQITDPLNQITRFSDHTAQGQPQTITHANGKLITRLTYNWRGQVTSEAQHNLETNQTLTTRYEYKPAGQLWKTIPPDGATITLEYDDSQRLYQVTDSHNNRLEINWNKENQPYRLSVIDGTSQQPVYINPRTYNNLNQLAIEFTANQDPTTTYLYNKNGKLYKATDADKIETIYAYDSLNRLKTVTHALGTVLESITQYHYDKRDNLLKVENPLKQATTYTYNALDQLLEENSPDRGLTRYSPDPAGNIVTKTDARNQTITYTYDALNRPKTLSYDDKTIVYDYEPGQPNRARQITDETGNTQWVYDGYGRVQEKQQETNGVLLTTRYDYNAQGQLSSLTYPSGRVIRYDYQQERISAVLVDNQPLLTNVTYQPFGTIDGWQWGNQHSQLRRYNLDGQLQTYTLGPIVREVDYNLLGQIKHIDGDTPALDYQYNVLGHLTQASGGGFPVQDFSYDVNGNRLTLIENNQTTTYSYPTTSNQLMALTGAKNQTFQYDAAGNLADDGLHRYHYDGRNRLTSVDDGKVHYLINGTGERVAKLGVKPDGNGNGGGGNGGGGQEPTLETLFADDFSGDNGRIIDDQTDQKWRGGPLKFGASATVNNQQAAIKAKKSITTLPAFLDNGSSELRFSVQMGQGSLNLTSSNSKVGFWLDYDGNHQVTIKVGSRWGASKQINKTLSLAKSQGLIAVLIKLKSGSSQVMVTDADNNTYDTGPMQPPGMVAGDSYQLQLQPLKGQTSAMQADAVAVQRSTPVTTLATVVADPDAIYYAYNDSQLIGEYNHQAVALQETVYLGNIPVAVIKGADIYYLHADHLNTPRVITDTTNNVVWSWQSDAFGNAKAVENTGLDGKPFQYNLRFPGQYFDAETGLHYNYFRDYNPQTGRYAQSDPIGLKGGTNTYGYAGGNPLSAIDPTGEAGILAAIPPFLEWAVPVASAGYRGYKAGGTLASAFDAMMNNNAAGGNQSNDGACGDECSGDDGGADNGDDNPTERPKTRSELDSDLKAKGFNEPTSSEGGYTTYKHSNGTTVTVKPNGEVITTQKKWTSDGSQKYSERQDYEGNRLPDQSHSTGYFVE